MSCTSSSLTGKSIDHVSNLSEVNCVRRILKFGFPANEVASVVGRTDTVHVKVERIHFSEQRPHQLHLIAYGQTGWQQDIFAEWVGGDAADYARQETKRLRKTRRGQLEGADDTAIHVIPDWGLVLRRPGLDTRLPGLRLLRHPEEVMELLRLHGESPRGVKSVELVAHRLGKRAVLKVTTTNQRVRFIRLRSTHSQSGLRCFHVHQKLYERLVNDTLLKIPEPIGFDDELGAAIFCQLDGELAQWQGQRGIRNCRVLGSALHQLQSITGLSVKHHNADMEISILDSLYKHVELFFPDLADQLRQPLKQVGNVLINQTMCSQVLTHRDLHQKQLLLARDRLGLLDFDTLCYAHPALDVANLNAHFYLSGLRGEYPSTRLEAELSEQFPRLEDHQYGPWRSAALLRLAMIYSFTHEPEQIVQGLIEEAESCCWK